MSPITKLLSLTALSTLLSLTTALPQNVVTTTVTVTASNCAATADPAVRIVVSPPSIALPVNGGPSELPSPPSNLTLKHITLGRGVQNYTCAPSAAATSAPVAVGAVATLFDVSSLVVDTSSSSSSSSSATILTSSNVDLLPALVASLTLPSLAPGSSISPFDALHLPPVGTFNVIGTHYFGSDGTPIFNLSSAIAPISSSSSSSSSSQLPYNILFAKKQGDIPAPSTANKGPANTGAVDWLFLGDNGKGLSQGLSAVYRVVTAGGNAPKTCADVTGGSVSVPYAAEYWFFQ